MASDRLPLGSGVAISVSFKASARVITASIAYTLLLKVSVTFKTP